MSTISYFEPVIAAGFDHLSIIHEDSLAITDLLVESVPDLAVPITSTFIKCPPAIVPDEKEAKTPGEGDEENWDKASGSSKSSSGSSSKDSSQKSS